MINFSDELKKFTPILDIEELENSIIKDDLKDIIDLLMELEQD